MQHFILYQAFGDKRLINECRYALLKYLSLYNLKPPGHISIVLYTDQPAQFENFAPFFHHFEMKSVTAQQLKQWRGANSDERALKIEILKDFFRQNNGHVLFCDTDTYIVKTPEELFSGIEQGAFVLHHSEGSLHKSTLPDFQKWHQLLQNHTVEYNGNKLHYSGEMRLWSTGVVGLNYNAAPVLDDVSALTAALYRQFQKAAAEPLAFSYCFQQREQVKTSDHVFKRYSHLKEFSQLLQTFFRKNEEESIPNLVKALHHLDAETILQQKQQYEQQPFYRKWINVLTGKSWSIKQYEKKI